MTLHLSPYTRDIPYPTHRWCDPENMRKQQYLVERDIQKYMAEYEVRYALFAMSVQVVFTMNRRQEPMLLRGCSSG